MEHKAGIRKTPLTALNVHPDNPRQGDVGAIIQSIETNGWYGTLVAQVSTGNVLAGNHRLQAAIHCGLDRVPVHWVDVDDDTARRILIADNRTSDLASYDDNYLAELLTEVATTEAGLLGTGWDGDDLDELIADLDFDTGGIGERGTALSVVDVSIAEPSITPETDSVYRLGRHTLYVSRVVDGWSRWVDGLDNEAAMFLPYPGPYVAMALPEGRTGVLVQPNKYVAGHIIDKWDSVNPDAPAERIL